MELNHTIRVDFRVWQELQMRRKSEAMTENDVLRQVFELPPLQSDTPSPLDLSPGDRVGHPAFGFGVVESRTGQMVSVRFEGESHSRDFIVREAKKAGMKKVSGPLPPPPPPPPPSKRMKLKVIFPDREVIFDHRVIDTFTRTIERVGVDRVRQLQMQMGGDFLIAERPGKRPAHWKQLSNGLYINANSSTEAKRVQLEDISNALGNCFRVEVVNPDAR